MITIREPKAMAEIRVSREELSRELIPLSPEECAALIKKGVAQFEEKHGIKLRRLKKETSFGDRS